jgi:hypothetical protein
VITVPWHIEKERIEEGLIEEERHEPAPQDQPATLASTTS